jgi:hypothetical protein
VRKHFGTFISSIILIRLAAGTTPAVLGFGALTAIVLGAYDYTGGTLTGYKKDPEMDEFERKEALRKNRRRPVEETIHELGEGRGTFHFCKIFMHELTIWKESMAQDTKKDEQSELRRSMALRCPQSHKLFLISLWVGFPGCRYYDSFVLESRNAAHVLWDS